MFIELRNEHEQIFKVPLKNSNNHLDVGKAPSYK